VSPNSTMIIQGMKGVESFSINIDVGGLQFGLPFRVYLDGSCPRLLLAAPYKLYGRLGRYKPSLSALKVAEPTLLHDDVEKGPTYAGDLGQLRNGITKLGGRGRGLR
jgi:hypothetical protein